MIYEYECQNCNYLFERTLKLVDRLIPTEEPCPECGQLEVQQYLGTMLYVDSHKLMTSRKPDSGFREVLAKIHENTPGSCLKQNSRFSF